MTSHTHTHLCTHLCTHQGHSERTCFSAFRLGSAAAQAVGSPPSLSPFSEWWTCLKVICVLAVTHAHTCAHSYQARPKKPSGLSIASLGSTSQAEPVPAPPRTWWPLTYDIISL